MDNFISVIKKLRLPIALGVSVLLFTAAALVGQNTIYRAYSLDLVREPFLTLVFEGIHDNIYPWDGLLSFAGDAEIEEGSEGSTVGSTGSTSAESIEQAVEVEPGQDVQEKIDSYAFTAPVTGEMPDGVNNAVMQAVDYEVVNSSFLSPDDTVYNTDTEGIFAQNGIYYSLRAVGRAYFEDALFIGDSRTVGLCEYGSLGDTASFLAKESVSVYTVEDATLTFKTPGEETTEGTPEEILSEYTFGKIYLSLGVNELGIGTTKAYYEKYREILEMIRRLQPDAVIYIQGIMHVSYSLSSSDSARNNTVIVQRNEAIATLANGYDIFYIDMNPYVCDEDGNLIDDLSWDGIHLKGTSYENWDRSLMDYAVVRSAKDDIAPEEVSEEPDDSSEEISDDSSLEEAE